MKNHQDQIVLVLTKKSCAHGMSSITLVSTLAVSSLILSLQFILIKLLCMYSKWWYWYLVLRVPSFGLQDSPNLLLHCFSMPIHILNCELIPGFIDSTFEFIQYSRDVRLHMNMFLEIMPKRFNWDNIWWSGRVWHGFHWVSLKPVDGALGPMRRCPVLLK